jgi:predicted nucleic acid-binding protein
VTDAWQPAVWDTQLLGKLCVHGTERERFFSQLDGGAGEPFPVASPVLFELAYGFRKGGERFATNLNLLVDLAEHRDVDVLAVDRRVAFLAAQTLALMPYPEGDRKGSKAEHRRRWAMDHLIAACAYRHGCGVCTENRRDFARIAEATRLALGDAAPVLAVAAPDERFQAFGASL